MAFSSHVAPGDGSDVFAFDVSNGAGQVGARFDAYGRRRVGTTGKPSAAVGAAAGTGPTGLSNAGTDEHGTVTVTTGTSPATGTLFTLTFNEPYATAPAVVLVDDNAGAQSYGSATTTTLTISAHSAPAASTPIKVNYIVVGG